MTKEEEEIRAKELEREAAERDRLRKIILPKPAQKVMLNFTSVHDLILAIERMAEFDRMLCDIGIIPQVDFVLEDDALHKVKKPFIKELVPLPPLEE